MKQILVVSGKGGTGKTTVTAALADSFAPLVLADTDVDAPNLHLLASAESTESSAEAFWGGVVAEVEPAGCTGCGLCEDLCRWDAIHVQRGSDAVLASVDAGACEGCGVCVDACPESAINERPQRAGDLIETASSFGKLVYGKLRPGQSNSGKLVSEVRRRTHQIATETDCDVVLVDGPPGVGCPVIAALTGIDWVVVVAEPTLASDHDLKRVLDLTAHFRVPASIVINKADLAPDLTTVMRAEVTTRGCVVLGEIPFDDAIPDALSQGVPVTRHAPEAEASRSLNEVATRLRQLVFEIDPQHHDPE